MEYVKTHLTVEIAINYIYTVHYFEYSRNYSYWGEEHDFWEFLYVDKGEVDVLAEKQRIRLRQGDIVFHKPREFHNVFSTGITAPNLVVVSFECKSPPMKYFEGKVLPMDNHGKNLLAQIIKEASNAYSQPLNITEQKKLKKRKNPLFGSEQLIKAYLGQLLIHLIRKADITNQGKRISSAVRENAEEDVCTRIIGYLMENVHKKLSFSDVVRFSNLSATNLKVIFRQKTGRGVIEYFRILKIDESKTMIREEKYNFTEIANKLGYESIHYFSRQFKQITGMNPTEYAISVKAKI